MSMADRKMDSTWLCRSSYDGRCEAMRTCRARSATLALVVLLSCVSSVSIAMSSSVRVGSRPHSWSYTEKWRTFRSWEDWSHRLHQNMLLLCYCTACFCMTCYCTWYWLLLHCATAIYKTAFWIIEKRNVCFHISCFSLFENCDCLLTISMVTRVFFFVTCAWENM